MMAENSLNFLPLDDPKKEVIISQEKIIHRFKVNLQTAQDVIEKGFDGSDIMKMKGILIWMLYTNL